ncbi:MAG: AtpZ/AtpI family protein [Bryobacteraceae bacterium]|nr:AtpZ/AtpI family protein [Bryobacteraceae bacterium]
MPGPGRNDRSFWVKYGEYSQLAVALPAATFVGYGIGYLLDRWLGTTFLYLVFLVIGIIAGLIQVVRFAQRAKD